MVTLRHVAFALLFFGISGATAASEPRATLEASARALAIPESVRAVTLTMQGVLHVRDQASRSEIPIVELPDRQSVLLVRDGRYRLGSDTTFPGAIRFHYLTIGSPTAWASVDLIRWRDGSEIDRTQAATGDAEFCDLLLLQPGLLLDDARRRAPDLSIDQASGDVSVTFRDRVDRLTTIAIDPATKLVRAATSGDRRYVYEDYRKRGDALQPQRIFIHSGTRLTSHWQGVAVAATNIDARTFDLPAGYVERADRGSLRATSLGHGAYRIDAAPSAYHTGGIAIRRQFENLPASAIEEVSTPRTLDLGDTKVILYSLASSHAAEMLVSYAPASRTVIRGR